MGHGGKRPGAGRPKGSRNKRHLVVDTPAADSIPSAAVEDYARLGLGHQDIAQLVGVGLTELRAKFASELVTGAAKGKAKVLAALLTLASTVGNRDQLAAIRLWLGIEGDRGRRLGKKEQAAEAAQTAGKGTEWGDLLETPGGQNGSGRWDFLDEDEDEDEPSEWAFLDERRPNKSGQAG